MKHIKLFEQEEFDDPFGEETPRKNVESFLIDNGYHLITNQSNVKVFHKKIQDMTLRCDYFPVTNSYHFTVDIDVESGDNYHSKMIIRRPINSQKLRDIEQIFRNYINSILIWGNNGE